MHRENATGQVSLFYCTASTKGADKSNPFAERRNC
jgi:hypothetical protein